MKAKRKTYEKREEMMIDKIVVSDWKDLLQSLADGSVDVVLTDMPYNITNCKWETEIDLQQWWNLVIPKIKDDGVVILTANGMFDAYLKLSNPGMYRTKWTWDKGRPTGFLNVDRYPLQITEDILIFSPGKHRFYPKMWWSGIPKQSKSDNTNTSVYGKANKRKIYKSQGERYPTNIIRLTIPNDERGKHPTQKPIGLMKYLLETYSKPGDLIVDPFCGSGPTAIAARLLDRRFVCGDISPQYVKLANERLRTEGRTVTEMPLFEGLEKPL